MARRGGSHTPVEQTTPFIPPTHIAEDSSSSTGPSPDRMYEMLGRGQSRGGGGGRRGDPGGPGPPGHGYPPQGFHPTGFPPHGYPHPPPPPPPPPPGNPYFPSPSTGYTPYPGYFPYGPYPPPPGPGGYPPPPPEAGGRGRGRDGGRGERGDPRGQYHPPPPPPPPPQGGPYSYPSPYGTFSPYGPAYPPPFPHPHAPPPFGVSPYPGMPPIPGGHPMPGMYPGSEFEVQQRSDVRPPSVSEMELDKWTPGSSYGPVLTPFQLSLLGISLEINPLLRPFTESSPSNQPHLEYNVLFPPNFAHRSDDEHRISWARGRNEPATLPRVSELRLISKKYPWVIDIAASKADEGITCIEVIQAIHKDATTNVRAKTFKTLPSRSQILVSKQYNQNRSTSRHAPGGAFDSGLKRGDFMLEFVMFNGLVNDQPLIAERFKVSGPGWNGLQGRDTTKRQTYPATLVFNLDNILMSDSVSLFESAPDTPTEADVETASEVAGDAGLTGVRRERGNQGLCVS